VAHVSTRAATFLTHPTHESAQRLDLRLCPGGKKLTTTGTLVNDNATMLYRASKHDCAGCDLKLKCCPSTSARKVPRSIYEGARDMARRSLNPERAGPLGGYAKRLKIVCPSQTDSQA
jgi:hypothetical protein